MTIVSTMTHPNGTKYHYLIPYRMVKVYGETYRVHTGGKAAVLVEGKEYKRFIPMDTDAFDHIEPLAMTLQEIELERKILGYK
jgi:hypothetical protein